MTNHRPRPGDLEYYLDPDAAHPDPRIAGIAYAAHSPAPIDRPRHDYPVTPAAGYLPSVPAFPVPHHRPHLLTASPEAAARMGLTVRPVSLDDLPLPPLATEPTEAHSHPLHMAGDLLAHHVLAMVEATTAEREARENHRANRRNINRVLVLAFAAVAGFLAVFMSTHGILPGMLPYSFCVAVGLDTLVTLYAYVRHY